MDNTSLQSAGSAYDAFSQAPSRATTGTSSSSRYNGYNFLINTKTGENQEFMDILELLEDSDFKLPKSVYRSNNTRHIIIIYRDYINKVKFEHLKKTLEGYVIVSIERLTPFQADSRIFRQERILQILKAPVILKMEGWKPWAPVTSQPGKGLRSEEANIDYRQQVRTQEEVKYCQQIDNQGSLSHRQQTRNHESLNQIGLEKVEKEEISQIRAQSVEDPTLKLNQEIDKKMSDMQSHFEKKMEEMQLSMTTKLVQTLQSLLSKK